MVPGRGLQKAQKGLLLLLFLCSRAHLPKFSALVVQGSSCSPRLRIDPVEGFRCAACFFLPFLAQVIEIGKQLHRLARFLGGEVSPVLEINIASAKRIGHFGFFRNQFQSSLWARSVALLQGFTSAQETTA